VKLTTHLHLCTLNTTQIFYFLCASADPFITIVSCVICGSDMRWYWSWSVLNFLGTVTILCRLLIRGLLSSTYSNMFIIFCLNSHRCPTGTKGNILSIAVLPRLSQCVYLKPRVTTSHCFTFLISYAPPQIHLQSINTVVYKYDGDFLFEVYCIWSTVLQMLNRATSRSMWIFITHGLSWAQTKYSHYIRRRIQKFPDWVDNEINNNKHLLKSNIKGCKTH
jgi:hypothetical protein